MRYAAVLCPSCGRASAARAGARTHQCPYCGAKFGLGAARVLLVGSAREVRAAVAKHNAGS
ncbi:MAG: DUF1922 domain-containing protein [Thermoproteaceae archaeon]|nr:DUF1922 domain-containing protein [Thermoproteaceae archaeon]